MQFPSAFDTVESMTQSCVGSLSSQGAMCSVCVAAPGTTPFAVMQKSPRAIWVGTPEPFRGTRAVMSLEELSPGVDAWRSAVALADAGANTSEGSGMVSATYTKDVCGRAHSE